MEDRTIATVNLVAAESLKRSAWLAFCRGVVNFFTSPGFWLTILTLIIAFVAWVFIMRQININRQRRRRAARKGRRDEPDKSATQLLPFPLRQQHPQVAKLPRTFDQQRQKAAAEAPCSPFGQ